MLTEHRRQEDVTEGVLGIVVAHGDLLEHHVTLDLDVVEQASPAQDDIGDQVDRQRKVRVEHMRVVAGVFTGGEGVQLTTDGVDRLRDLHRRAVRRRLEQQVLQEVGRTGDGAAFVPGPHTDPHPDRRGVHRRNVLGDHTKATGQFGAAHRGGGVLAAAPASQRCRSSCWRSRHQQERQPGCPPSRCRRPRRRESARSCRDCRCRRSRPAACHRP